MIKTALLLIKLCALAAAAVLAGVCLIRTTDERLRESEDE